MSYSFFLARRLSLSSGSHRRSPSVAVSITAVALSIAVMIAAVAIVTGFKREIRDKVVYFGPMGCQTGFYLLVRNTEHRRVLSEIKRVLKEITEYEGEVFGNSEKECGNCHNLDLAKAKSLCAAYLEAIFDKTERDLYYEM